MIGIMKVQYKNLYQPSVRLGGYACTMLGFFFINSAKILVISRSSFLKTLMFAITTIQITGSILQPPSRGQQGEFCYTFLCIYLFHQWAMFLTIVHWL